MSFSNLDSARTEATNAVGVKGVTSPDPGCSTLRRSHDMLWCFPDCVKFIRNMVL